MYGQRTPEEINLLRLKFGTLILFTLVKPKVEPEPIEVLGKNFVPLLRSMLWKDEVYTIVVEFGQGIRYI